MRQLSLLVLPAHRPASPEMAESPTLTTHGAPTPGPSARAGLTAPNVVSPAAARTLAKTIRTQLPRARMVTSDSGCRDPRPRRPPRAGFVGYRTHGRLRERVGNSRALASRWSYR